MSQAFWNAFWVFVGIVAGSLVQFGLQWLTTVRQRKAALRLMKIEARINRDALLNLKQQIKGMREAVAANEPRAVPAWFDMTGFNYTLSAPLIGAGYFHDILASDGVSAYFKFANQLNVSNATVLTDMYQKDLDAGTPLTFLRWLDETKFQEWNQNLQLVEKKLSIKQR